MSNNSEFDKLALVLPLGSEGDVLFPLQQGLSLATQRLQNFAQSPDFSSKFKIAFGDNADLTELQTAWAAGDFSTLPKIEVRPAADINGANGAYAAAFDTVYVSQEFLSQNADDLEKIASVLIEEIGHGVDAQVNPEDIPGDEGAILAALVRGETLSSEDLALFRAEDDTTTVTLEEIDNILIEQSASTNVSEISNYTQIYQLDIPNDAAFSATGTPLYGVDNSATVFPEGIERIGYYLELDTGSGSQWVWASMEAFTQDLRKIGIPTVESVAFWQQTVSNMNVESNVPGIVTGQGITTGNIEFWPYGYNTFPSVSRIGGSGSDYDFNDLTGLTDSSYGSMQIHNYGAEQTLLAYNGWNVSGFEDVGIGNNTAINTRDGLIHPDWTFSQNASDYTLKQLEVWVQPNPDVTVNTAPKVSIFDAAGDFSAIRNPNGNWQYGWSQTLGSPFNLANNQASFFDWNVWRSGIPQLDPGLHPGVQYNRTNSDLSGTLETRNFYILTPGQLSFIPSPTGEFGVIRWTATANGVYQLSTSFEGVNGIGVPPTSDVHVLKNGVSIFDGFVNGFGTGSGPSFKENLSLLAGDTIDFAVGYGTDLTIDGDVVAIDALIKPAAATDVTVNENAANTIINLFDIFEDTEDPDSALTYTLVGNTNPTLFTSTEIAGGNLTLDYAPNVSGTADITLRATDTGELSVDHTFTVTVNPFQSISTEVGNGADTWILERDPNTNYGSENRLVIKNDFSFSNLNRKPYIRFDLGSVDKTRIEAANFVLNFIDTSAPPTPTFTYSVYGLNDGTLGEDWDEATITWNNAPGNGANSTLEPNQTTLLGTFSFNPSTTPSGTPLTFSDSRLTNFLKSDTNDLATLIILRNQSDESGERFSSKENTLFEPPTLQLELLSQDNDLPLVSISPPILSQPEGDSGTTAYTYTVSLDNSSDQVITVNYSTNDGTATVADGDYRDNNGTLIFTPGEPLSQEITVLVNGDNNNEPDETFTLTLNNATNALLTGARTTNITAISGGTVEISPPASVELNTPELESNSEAFVFTERSGVLLNSDLIVDVLDAGTTVTGSNNDSPGPIPSGTLVNSLFLHFDPSRLASVSGAVTLDQEILGVILSASNLDASDNLLGGLETVYPTGLASRGVVLEASDDSITLSADRRTLTYNLAAQNSTDQLRIITATTVEASGIIENDDPLNNNPVATNDSYNTNEDIPITIDVANGVLANDSDPDGDPLTATLVGEPTNGTLTFESDGSFNYTPNPDFSGTDSFTYQASDSIANSNTATVTIEVANVDQDPPIANDDSYSVLEDNILTVNATNGVLNNDSDPDGDAITANLVRSTSNGELVFNTNGSFTYTPNPDFFGNDSFIYQIDDGNENVALGTANIAVETVNEQLLISDGLVTEGKSDTMSFKVTLTTPRNETVEVNYATEDIDATAGLDYQATSGTLSFAPGELEKTIEVPILDDDLFEDDETFSLTLSDPVAATIRDGEATGTIVDNEGLVDLRANFRLLGEVNKLNSLGFGELDLRFGVNSRANLIGRIDYNSFTPRTSGVLDSLDLPSIGWAEVDVPFSVDFSLYLDREDRPDASMFIGLGSTDVGLPSGSIRTIFDFSDDVKFAGSLLDNDPDEGLTLTSVTLADGTPLADSGLQFDFIPNNTVLTAEASAADTAGAIGLTTVTAKPPDKAEITFPKTIASAQIVDSVVKLEVNPEPDPLVYDLAGASVSGTNNVRLTRIGTLNEPPVANNDDLTTDEDNPVSGNVLADNGNGADSDPDGDTLSVTEVNGSSGDIGTQITLNSGALLTLNANGTFDYNPNGRFEFLTVEQTATDTFNYTIDDGNSNSGTDTATVNITINGVNDTPVATDDNYSTDEDIPLNVDALAGVLANDSDVDGDNLSVTVTEDVENGTLILNNDGSFDYTPNTNFNGVDSFAYTLSDGNGETDTAIVNLTVNPVNDAPVAVDDNYSIDEDIPLNVDALAGVLANDSDVDGDNLSVTVTEDVENGTLILNNDGSFDYTPNTNFNGVDSFAYTLSDGNGETDTAIVNLTVNPVNDAPVAVDDNYSTDEDTPLNVNAVAGVLVNDSDVDGDSLTVTVTEDVDNGNLTLNHDGSFDYIPNTNFNGVDSFTYTLSDGNGGTDTAIVSVTVNPNNEIVGTDGNDFLKGTDEDDVIRALAGEDKVLGKKGNDLIEGNEGKDTLLAGDGQDTVFGGEAQDKIFGNQGDDLLSGDAGNDNIVGGLGNDLIIGGTGNDRLRGGFGRDTFIFGLGDGKDSIVDFQLTRDQIGLVEGELTFEQLSFTQQGRNTILGVTNTEELAVFRHTDADDLNNPNLFVMVADISSIDDI